MGTSQDLQLGCQRGVLTMALTMSCRTGWELTVDARNPAWLKTYYTTAIPRVLAYKFMQDFYHQPQCHGKKSSRAMLRLGISVHIGVTC